MASSSSQPPPDNNYDVNEYLGLYAALLQGDLENVKNNLDSDALAARITVKNDTALHVAVGTTGMSNHIVEHLLTVMSRDQVACQNNDGNTALSVAAIVGNVEAAAMMLKEYPDLNAVPNNCGWIPLVEAARYGQREMVTYLWEFSQVLANYPTPDEKYATGQAGVFFMNLLIISGFYDLALRHIRRHSEVALKDLHGGDCVLSAIAEKPSAFASGRSLNFWQRFIYHCAPIIEPMPKLNIFGPRYESYLKIAYKKAKAVVSLAPWTTLKYLVPNAKEMQEIKLMHHQALKFVKQLCENAVKRLDYRNTSSLLKPSLLLAAEQGIHEIVKEIIVSFPHAVWFSNEENHNAFHLAVMNRQEKVFNLIFETRHCKHLLLISQDTHGNNILHLAGKLAPQNRLNLIAGAAMQMQHELRWFKEVEKIVRAGYKEDKNSEGKTPAMVFTEAHKELVKEGEKWMKDTASSCSLVAVLIATIVFAAAITVPGGYINDNGHPIFLNEKAFIIFGISDALSLFSSVTAILMFLSTLTARFAEADFLYVLPKRLIWGLVTLFLSITAMMVAFSATIYMVLCDKKAWMLIPVGGLACLPVSIFASLQFPLLLDMFYSTYGPGILGKQSKRMHVKGNRLQVIKDHMTHVSETLTLRDIYLSLQ